MLTSYYAVTPDRHPGAICISRYAPRGSKYGMYQALAPGSWFRSVSQDDYVPLYFEILRSLSPQQVWDDLHRIAYKRAIAQGLSNEIAAEVEPILLCYEKPTEMCHRRFAANWLEWELGVSIPEGKIDRKTGAVVYSAPWEKITTFSYAEPCTEQTAQSNDSQLSLNF